MSEKKPTKPATEKKPEKKAKSPYEEYNEKQIKAVFEVFDEDRNGRAKLKHLGTVLRALGRVITDAELKEIEEKVVDPEFRKYMRYESLLPVATKILQHDNFKSDSMNVLLRAFSTLDREGKGYMDADYLKRIFKEYGDNHDEDVIERFFNDAVDPDSRTINYREFCEKLVVPPCFDIEDNRRKIRLELTIENSRIT